MTARRLLVAHVALFVLGNLGLVLLWVAEAGFPLGWDPDPYWPAWVHATWGLGLLLHARSARAQRAAGSRS